jgi:cytoskeleton protein RodZ
MESFGQYLRRERELRNISLDEIAEVTKINRFLLQAIEEDKFDLLPGKLFIRGFLRAYCRYIGLDEEDVLLRFQAYWEELNEPDVKKEERKGSLGRLGLIIVLVVCLGGFLLFWLKKPENGRVLPTAEDKILSEELGGKSLSHESGQPEIPQPDVLTQETLSIPGQSEEDLSGIDPGESQVESQQNKEVGKEEKSMVLEAWATEETWIKIRIDGQPPEEIILESGESITWKAKQDFNLVIGNAGGLEMFFEGEKLGYLGPPGKVVVLNLP